MRVRPLFFIAVTVTVLTAATLAPRVASAAVVELVTLAEAKLGPYQGQRRATREMSDGPTIEVISPQQFDGDSVPELTSPVHIVVTFHAANNAAVDMSSLRVTYLAMFGVDVTDRLKPYITGSKIDVPNAKMPSGEHEFRVEIKDSAGHKSTVDFHFVVKDTSAHEAASRTAH